MNNKIYEILNTLEQNGFESYIVGGYVRDFIMNHKSYDIDIATTATVKDLNNILSGTIKNTCYGAFKINIPPYNIDITTYRRELSYNNRYPTVEYIKDIKEDILRRDFTINTLIMDKNGNITDYLGGIKDIQEKRIKCVGNPYIKLEEDPLRILRALRFYAVLNFNIEKETIKAIKKYKYKLKELSKTRVKEELDKILMSPNITKTFDYLKKLGILKELEIKYKKIRNVEDLSGMYAQLELPLTYPFTKKEKNNIKHIQKILKYVKIDNIILYEEGLYYTQIAGLIKGMDRSKISKMEVELPIHNRKDILLNINDLLELNIPKDKINKVYTHLEKMILTKKIKNKKEDLQQYLLKNKRVWLNE